MSVKNNQSEEQGVCWSTCVSLSIQMGILLCMNMEAFVLLLRLGTMLVC